MSDFNPGKRVSIIGGGVGGLAAAIRLAALGNSVTIFEKNARVGGKLNRWTAPHPRRPDDRPFQFDTGPSLLTLPLVFADLFAFAGEDVRDHLHIQRLDPISRLSWRDGAALELTSNRPAFLEQIRQFAPGDVDGVQRLLRYSQHIWDLAGETFLSQSPEQTFRGDGAFHPIGSLRALSIPFRIGMFRKFHRVIDRYIRDPRLRHVFYQYATYSGASPFLAPGTLAVIPHVEIDQGAWHIEGGMYQLAEALVNLCTKLGVDIRINTSVSRMVMDDHGPRVVGVELSDGQHVPSDAVVCNADVRWAYEHLLDPLDHPQYPPEKLQQLEPGGSGFVLMMGVEGKYPQLTHHNKFMPADYGAELREVFEQKKIPADPCVYVCCTTRTDPSQAPEGCENLFVLCSAPPLDGSIDWSIMSRFYRDQIVQTLENQWGLTDLSRRIVVEQTMSPHDLAGRYNAHAGAIYGLGSNSLRQAFMRPPNRDRHIQGLFFAGNTTHPGGGLPLVALSGKIAAEEVVKYLQAAQRPSALA